MTVKSKDLTKLRELDLEMSNLDGTIDPGLSEALVQEMGQVFAQHSAWNFCGYVWYAQGRFHEEVWVYHVLQEVIHADTLSELMSGVNDKYGYK